MWVESYITSSTPSFAERKKPIILLGLEPS